MKHATRRLLAVFAILAVSAVALFGGVGIAQGKTGTTPASSFLNQTGNGTGSGSATVTHVNFLGCVVVTNSSGSFLSCD